MELALKPDDEVITYYISLHNHPSHRYNYFSHSYVRTLEYIHDEDGRSRKYATIPRNSHRQEVCYPFGLVRHRFRTA